MTTVGINRLNSDRSVEAFTGINNRASCQVGNLGISPALFVHPHYVVCVVAGDSKCDLRRSFIESMTAD